MEQRLIDANALEPDTEWDEYGDGFMSYSQIQIDNAPTVDAVLVVHGHWEMNGEEIRCSHCLNSCGKFPYLTEDEMKVIMEADKFCYNCGAKMDESFSRGHENDEVDK